MRETPLLTPDTNQCPFSPFTIHVFYYAFSVFGVIIPAGFVVSLFLGEKFDFMFIYPAIASFLFFFVYGSIKQFPYTDIFMSQMHAFRYDFLSLSQRKFLMILCGALITLGAIGVPAEMSFGGLPEIVDNTYVIVSHGNIVKSITEEQYTFLRVTSRYSWCVIEYAIHISAFFSVKNDFFKLKAK